MLYWYKPFPSGAQSGLLPLGTQKPPEYSGHFATSNPNLLHRICSGRMIELLYTLIFSEMALVLALLFRTPLRKLLIMVLDLTKRGRGPIMVKSVAATVLIVFLSSVYTMVEIQRSITDPAAINPTDQVIMAWKMLETSLMGNWCLISLFLILARCFSPPGFVL